MELIPEKLVDQDYNIHWKGTLLGQGGQGVVFRTKDPNIAIKLVTDSSGVIISDQQRMERFQKQLRLLRLLPLPHDSHISVPVILLKDHLGYIMQFMGDMVPFASFWPDAKSLKLIDPALQKPEWAKGIRDDYAIRQIIHYINTGGLRRRLIALYKCASILTRIHAGGLVYGDISPQNIYISKDAKYAEVWFIDADNLRFEISKTGSRVFTPSYGAPELVQNKDCGRPRSDCYAFSIMAFYMLSMIHPFIGKATEEDDADWASDGDSNEDQAYAGHLPWVDDPVDTSNSNQSGWPRGLILTKELNDLFHGTFEDGRLNYWKRPSIYHWAEAFARAADSTLMCPECKMTYLHDIQNLVCPYCSTLKSEQNYLFIESYQWNGNPELDAPLWTFARELDSDTGVFNLPQRLFMPFSMTQSDHTELKLMLLGKMLEIRKPAASHLDLSVGLPGMNGGKLRAIHTQFRIPMASAKMGFWLYIKSAAPRMIKCSIRSITNET